ncbi:MAG: 2OG-Fe(II) oxygenase family protein [Halioglobus sp.]
MSIDLSIHTKHNPDTLAQTLRTKGRLQIPDFLTVNTSEYLHRLLRENTVWHLSYNEGQDNFESEESAFNSLSPAQRQKFLNNIYSRAKDNFQYLFKQYYISQAIKLGENTGHPMHQVNDWVNSAAFLNFMRSLTATPEIRESDSYASIYGPGHFLTMHDDRHASHDRVAAWVISMTPEWNENWGGYLAFYDEKGNVTEAFKPAFNTLNIFTVPQKHAVQLVTPFAGQPRTSYLGWLLR